MLDVSSLKYHAIAAIKFNYNIKAISVVALISFILLNTFNVYEIC